ncbi:hypothetical protein H0H81_009383 [Sphagnurus paluster]|uniref:Uncharacterized protein n=1 Tax=Sphagnurus paluster TaxID=117069 RepID=A0A9P7GJJ8_9AGAR|nr:hypothetical protein H0H81_009383 [Sphagnurus paluster]
MRHVGSINPTHHVHRFLAALLGVPLATEENEDAQGTPTLWFHESRGKDGNISNKQGLDKVKKAINGHSNLADLLTQDIIELKEKEAQDKDNTMEMKVNQQKLGEKERAIVNLQTFYKAVETQWSDTNHNCDIGHVQYAAPITVDVEGSTRHTSDWAAFQVTEEKVRSQFKGNIIDLESKYSPPELMKLFYPMGGPTFNFPTGRKLRIAGCATKEDLTNPTEIDREGQPCLIVGKDGNTTDITTGHYAGLVLFTLNEASTESVELGIYNWGIKHANVFSAEGDSGSLVWYTRDKKAFIVGQIHSGSSIGSSTSNHVTYCTPGWHLLDQTLRTLAAIIKIYSNEN